MRTIPFLLLALLGGCATARATAEPELPARVIAAGETATFRVTGNEEAQLYSVRANASQVWRALPGVFETLEIPITHIDTNVRLIGNRDHAVSRRLGGEPLHRYLNCGSSMTGPVTRTHLVRLSLLVQVVEGEGDQALVQSLVDAEARSRQGVSGGGPITCGSTGRLEARIAQMLNETVDG